MNFETLTVTEEGESATLTGTREEILELLSYGSLWASTINARAEEVNVAEGWRLRYEKLSELFRTIAR